MNVLDFEVQVSEVVEKPIVASSRTTEADVQVVTKELCAFVLFWEDHRVNA